MVSFTLNGTDGHGRRPPAPAGRPPRGARRHLAQGRLLAVGPVRLLHGADRRQGHRELQPRRWPRSRAARSPPSRASTTAERERMAAAFAATGALQCGFCTPGIVMRAKYLLDKNGAGLTRDKAARHLGGHLCRCTGYHPILDAVELLAAGHRGRPAQPPGPTVGDRGKRYQVDELAMGDKPYVDDMRVDGDAARRRASWPSTPGPTSSPSTPRAAEAEPGVVRVLTAADVPGELRIGLIHQDWPVVHPRGRAHVVPGDVLALVVADDRATARAGGRAGRGRVPRRWRRSPTRSPRSSRRRRGRGVGARRQRPVPLAPTPGATSTPRSRPAPTSCTRCSRPSGSSTPSSSPSRRSRCPLRRRHAAGVLRRPGRVGRPATRSPTCSASTEDARRWCTWSPTAAPSAARRTAPTRPRPRWPRGCCGRPVKCTLSREESLLVHPKRHPIRIEASGGLRRRRPAHRAAGPDASATRAPTPRWA